MRHVLRLFTAFALLGGLIASGATPADAQTVGAGAGEVVGNVTIQSPASGIPLHVAENDATQFCDGGPTSYTFGSTVLTGAITGTGPSGPVTYAGPINATASGSVSGCEDSSGVWVNQNGAASASLGTGTVGGTITGASGACTISGTIDGSFSRVGPLVIVTLLATYTITCTVPGVGTVSASGKADVKVAAAFAPTDGDGVNDPVRAAAFSGAWQAVDATA